MKLMFKLFLLLIISALIFIYFKHNLTANQKLFSPLSEKILRLIPTPTPSVAPVTVGLVGDLGLGRYVTATARSRHDFSWSFSGVSSWLKSNDLNLGNLETPIIDNCPTSITDSMIFCADPGFLPTLKENKFVLDLANNHILNYGSNGLTQTQNYLNQNQISFVYSHSPQNEFKKINIKNMTFGFLGFDLTGAHQIKKDYILSLVKKYNPEVDWLIVSLHWGNEYSVNPSQSDINFGHELVDNGADIIAGHHPHVYHPEETYKNKLIYYSLGNFIFDQNWSPETSQSNIVKITLNKNQIVNTQKTPIIIQKNSRPEPINSP